ncbi:MAG TPA: hypothetical protein ENI23_17575 [bacterium]|nr:hypothetical protein [bacterium]
MEQPAQTQQSTPLQPEEKKKPKTLLLVLIFVLTAVVFTVVGAGGYWFLTRDTATKESEEAEQTPDNTKETEESAEQSSEKENSDTVEEDQKSSIKIDYSDDWKTLPIIDKELARLLTQDGCLRAIVVEEGEYTGDLDESIITVYKSTQSEDIVNFLHQKQFKISNAKETKTIASLDYSHLFTLFFTDGEKVYSVTMNFLETETGTQEACADVNDPRIDGLLDSITL